MGGRAAAGPSTQAGFEHPPGGRAATMIATDARWPVPAAAGATGRAAAWDTTGMARILIVEDERDLNDLIARQLRQEGHDPVQAFDGPAALAAVDESNPELVILDWMLPKLDGLTVAR